MKSFYFVENQGNNILPVDRNTSEYQVVPNINGASRNRKLFSLQVVVNFIWKKFSNTNNTITPFLKQKCSFAENQNNNILQVDDIANHNQVVPVHLPLQNEPRRRRGRPRTRRERGNRKNNAFIVSYSYLSNFIKFQKYIICIM